MKLLAVLILFIVVFPAFAQTEQAPSSLALLSFSDAGAAYDWAVTHNISPGRPAGDFELGEYLYLFRTAHTQYLGIERNYDDEAALDFMEKMNGMTGFLPPWFNRDNPQANLDHISRLNEEEIIINNVILILYRDAYALGERVYRGVNQIRYKMSVERAKLYDDALLDYCRRAVRNRPAGEETAIPERLEEEAVRLNGRLPSAILALERIYTLIPFLNGEGLGELKPTAAGIAYCAGFIDAGPEALRAARESGLDYLPGAERLIGRYDAAGLETALSGAHTRLEKLREDHRELEKLDAGLGAGRAPAAADLLAEKREYLPLYYELYRSEGEVWGKIAADIGSLEEALAVLESPGIPGVLPESLTARVMEQVEADSVRLAMQGVDSPAYPAVIRIQKFYEEHPDRLPPTGEASRLFSLLKQLFQPEEAATERAQTVAPQSARPASPNVAVDTSAEARSTETVIRTVAVDINNNPNFANGFCEYDTSIWDYVTVDDINGKNAIDLYINDNNNPDFYAWSDSNDVQFRDSSNNLIGFIYGGKYYSVDGSGLITAIEESDSAYSYNEDTGVMIFYDPALYSGLDTVNGAHFYNLTVTPNTGAGTITITDYAPGSRAYTADGSYLFDLPAGSSYTLNISLEQFIAICLAGGLYIGIPGDAENPCAVISPGSLVSQADPADQKFELTVSDRNTSRAANHYAGLISARQIKHTDIAAATPRIKYQSADVSYLFAPQIEYLGAAKYRNGLLIGAGEVIIKTSHWELDAGGNPVQIEQEIKLQYPEEAEYITGDKVDIPAGLNLNYKLLPADLDRADRAALAAQGIDLLGYLSAAFTDPRNNAVLGFYLNIEGRREYVPLPRFAQACAEYRAAYPEIPVIGWEDLAGILSMYKGRELRDISPREVVQVSRATGLTLTPEAGAGWDSRAGFFTPLGLRMSWDTPQFSLNAYLGEELNVETMYHKITGGLSALGAPLGSLPGLQIFGGAEAETRIISVDYPLASGGKARLGFLYDWHISDEVRWRNALGGKFLAVFLDGDIQATAWKAEYESTLQTKRWSPYFKTGILFAENKMFLAEDALYRDFTRDLNFDQLELGMSFAALAYKDIFALDLNFNTDIAAGSLGAGFSVVLQKPRGLRWDISALGAVSPMQECYTGSRENPLDTAQLNISSALRWPSGFFLKAAYELEYAGEIFHRATLSGGYIFQIHR